MDEEYQYTEAFSELQAIVAEIERGDISIDELSQKVKRAATLIALCKAKLTATEADVSAILETLKPADPAQETAEDEEGTADAGILEEPERTSADEDPEQEEE